MADTLQLGLDVAGGRNIAVRQMPEVELHPWLEAPFQRHLIDGDRRAATGNQRAVHGRMVMIGRVQMGAVMGGQADAFHRPAFAIGQISFFQPGEKSVIPATEA